MEHHLLPDIALSIMLAAVLGTLVYRLKQPTMLGYFIAGAILGPGVGFGLVSEPESIEIISEIGLVLLLFVIGLEMNLSELASAGKQLFVTAIGQFVLCAAFGVALFTFVPMPGAEGKLGALYLGLLCALSSTAVVVKLLYDKFELDTAAGRITIGVLVMQDLWAILVLALQPNFANPQFSLVAIALGKSAGLVAIGYFTSKVILSRVLEYACKSSEVVMLLSIGWCAGMGALAGVFGLSIEMGALIAGASVSAFPFRIHVIAKTLPLRDFFLTLFFVSLGMKIVAPEKSMLLGAAMLAAFVIVSRFLSIYPLLRMSGGGHRIAFITSVNLSQISEFSLVIAALGISYGHITGPFLAMMIYAMAGSAVLSSYLIKYNAGLYSLYASWFLPNIKTVSPGIDLDGAGGSHGREIVILGYHHCGRELVDLMLHSCPDALARTQVIDFNVEALRTLDSLPVEGMFADFSNFGSLEHAHIDHAAIIICTLPDLLLKGTSNLQLVSMCRTIAPHARIIAIADNDEHRMNLMSSGATDAILWYQDKATALLRLVSDEPVISGIIPGSENGEPVQAQEAATKAL